MVASAPGSRSAPRRASKVPHRAVQPGPASPASGQPAHFETHQSLPSPSKRLKTNNTGFGKPDRLEDERLPGPQLEQLQTSAKSRSGRVKAAASVQVQTPEALKSISMATATARADSMYQFGPGVVDLTSSPTSSPQRRNGVPGTRVSTSRSGALHAPKTIQIKNRKDSRSDPEQYYRTIWEKLDTALDAIFSSSSKTFSMEELYRGVENICRQGRALPLFQALKARCKRHMTGTVRPELVSKAGAAAPISTLQAVTQFWAVWRKQMFTISSIFCYLDRSFLLHSDTLPQIDELSTSLFCQFVTSDPDLKPKVLAGLAELLAMDRDSDNVAAFDAPLFREALAMFHSLKIYTTEVEPYILSESQSYFLRWSDGSTDTLTLAEYVKGVSTIHASEQQRCTKFNIDATTWRQLVTQMETLLIERQEKRLVDSGEVGKLLMENQYDVLRDLFALLQKRRLGEKLKPAFEAHILAAGSDIVFDEKHVQEMVQRLLKFKKKLDHVLTYAFQDNQQLNFALKESFETFINKTKRTEMTWGTDNNKPGEMIAKYLDLILRQGAKAIAASEASAMLGSTVAQADEDGDDDDEDSQLASQLDSVLELFRFVRGKGTFEAFYKNDLAKRLLMNRSASADAEQSMLRRLRSECGAGFTHNLEQMFKDIELARDENVSYKTQAKRKGQLDIDFNVNVLSKAAWPTYPTIPVEVPQEIQQATETFTRYYSSKHKNRKLEWMHSLAYCDLTARFDKGIKSLIVSSFQAVVLLQFNTVPAGTPVNYLKLQDATRLSDEELQRTLQSLACARYRVLTKSPRGKEVARTDRFVLNTAFTDPKIKIRINQIQLKETPAENKQTHEREAANREYETQAAIVRIMKGARTLKHVLLVAQTIDALKSRGAVNAESIKKQIDKLIDKDYIQRTEDGEYSYVA